MIDVTAAVSTVYVLSDLEKRITDLRRSDTPRAWRLADYLEDLGRRVSDAKAGEVTLLARAFRDYIVLTCMAEARYGRNKADKFWPDLGFHEKTRHDVTCEVRGWNRYTPDSMLNAAKLLFGCCWKSGYGGDSWRKIAKAGLLYGTIPDEVFLDHVVDLSHNSGLFLDKCVIFNLDNPYIYKNILDFKTSIGLLSADSATRNYRDDYLEIPYHKQHRDLLAEAKSRGLFSSDCPLVPTDDPPYEDEVVVWGVEVFAPNVQDSYRYDSYNEDNDDDNEEEEESESEPEIPDGQPGGKCLNEEDPGYVKGCNCNYCSDHKPEDAEDEEEEDKEELSDSYIKAVLKAGTKCFCYTCIKSAKGNSNTSWWKQCVADYKKLHGITPAPTASKPHPSYSQGYSATSNYGGNITFTSSDADREDDSV